MSSASGAPAPGVPNGLASSKSKPAPPALSSIARDDDTLELKDMLPSGPPTPPAGDIMRLAQIGDEYSIRKLLESGTVPANYADVEGITPLHWAAINNRYAVCKLLLEAGADVNAVGGESVATPAMWAAQGKHYYIVNLLFQNGADALITDGQGYNILHLATFNGNLLLIILLLHQGIKVDVADSQGHTPLMWAAYKGFPHCVDLFLRWGADVTAVDEKSLTALHWGLVKGNYLCIQKLLEYGSDRFHKTDEGHTPLQAAKNMETSHVYQEALSDCDYTPEGRDKHADAPFFLAIPETRAVWMNRFFFSWPFVMEFAAWVLLASLPIFLSIPVTAAVATASHWVTTKALEYAPINQKSLHRTPYLAGIFAGTCFWVLFRWVMVVLPSTYASHPVLNFLFFTFFSMCVYFYSYSMMNDPGFVPKLAGREEQKAMVHDLLQEWKYDDKNFCTACMIRMPLRSKHCRRCSRCVAKHDHHCPWIFNCVGVNNHPQFFAYIITLEIGIFLFITLVVHHITSLPAPVPEECLFLPSSFCKPILVDSYTTVITIWAALQTTWVTMLLVVQGIQVLRNQTTYENMHRVSHGHDDHQVSTTVASMIAGGTTSLDGLQVVPNGAGPDPVIDGHEQLHGHSHAGHNHSHGGHGHANTKRGGFFKTILRLLGVDTFMATAKDGVEGAGHNRSNRSRANPFSQGVVTNCKDFWCTDSMALFKGRPSGESVLAGQKVDYFTMYSVPARMRTRGAYQMVGEDEEEV